MQRCVGAPGFGARVLSVRVFRDAAGDALAAFYGNQAWPGDIGSSFSILKWPTSEGSSLIFRSTANLWYCYNTHSAIILITCIHMYIYIHTCIYIYIHMYIYTYSQPHKIFPINPWVLECFGSTAFQPPRGGRVVLKTLQVGTWWPMPVSELTYLPRLRCEAGWEVGRMFVFFSNLFANGLSSLCCAYIVHEPIFVCDAHKIDMVCMYIYIYTYAYIFHIILQVAQTYTFMRHTRDFL